MALQVNALRRQLGIRVSGFDAPAPVTMFEECGLGVPMLAAIKAAKCASHCKVCSADLLCRVVSHLSPSDLD